jgi:hypothetical protein
MGFGRGGGGGGGGGRGGNKRESGDEQPLSLSKQKEGRVRFTFFVSGRRPHPYIRVYIHREPRGGGAKPAASGVGDRVAAQMQIVASAALQGSRMRFTSVMRPRGA